jgi:predicted nucleotidyltransferase
MVQAEKELSVTLGRAVDLVERSAIQHSDNWIRRRSILANAKVIYAR